jgi:hypothetical protein
MSDKLKTMQPNDSIAEESEDLYCASIGYPELRVQSNAIDASNRQCAEQPLFYGNPFAEYVSKTECEEFVSRES